MFNLFRLFSLAFALLWPLYFSPMLFAQEKTQNQLKSERENIDFNKQEELALMAEEPSLSLADIDVVINMASVSNEEEEAKMMAESGISYLRLDLILAKIGFGMLMLSGVDAELIVGGDIPKVFIPNPAELDLIEANLERIAGAEPGGEEPLLGDSLTDKGFL